MISLRQELCSRLQQAIQQWQQKQCKEWANDWEGLPLPAGADSAVLSLRSRAAESGNGVAAIRATVASMQLLLSSPAVDAPDTESAEADWTHSDWCELILGRRTDRVTGRSWDPSLLQSLQPHTQNFLLLSWRARAAQLGGVPTLLSAGRGITMVPYQRMKNIGIKPISRRPSSRPQQASNCSHIVDCQAI